ncbi:MAG TPA: 3-phosphoserine/phosphohydroxythreonine transaminase [Chitinophagales bacterium]|nr:3-phosphoserine/phosphohydroxythreonine transaminase [Chitinophagales bacterium]HMY23352.1 3-phosphoserine/phosphohydroxythreonine transaminase [Chitinophagales bacterium]HMZ34701.1 3-phosphoserine/phosphohydroxythreonine transaminase [Chitinophagales bacterium]HNA39401.1 3-phosphoserine/phosphohydroxythreonine transaminase [Chitinophagales bacterium]HNB49189.1 3-phosphoserine/phosphohydroxythreonine transaminase [Chitinophagales bacterium]
MKKHNFGAGPSILPQEVFEQSAQACLDYNGIGLSLLEISHRSKEFTAILEESISLIKSLLNVPDDYSILFLQGGANMQFNMIPYNILNEEETALFIETDIWSTRAEEETRIYGKTKIIASSKADQFKYIPKDFTVDKDAAYLHITSNNTIYGTEFFEDRDYGVPLVCDMSSDIFSRPIDVSKYHLIYAGAQKNLGCSGITLVIIKNEWLGRAKRAKSKMWDYSVYAKNNSLYNTPPVFTIYTCLLTLRWLNKLGGLQVMEQRNKAKAELLYAEIDRNPLFAGHAAVEDRSRMNINFITTHAEDEDKFLEFVKPYQIHGIKGYRTVGGFRASCYNALPIESVQVLVQAMQDFEKAR